MSYLEPDHLRSDLEYLRDHDDDPAIAAEARSKLGAWEQSWFYNPSDARQQRIKRDTLAAADLFVRDAFSPLRDIPPSAQERAAILALLKQRAKSQPYIVKHWHTVGGAKDQCAESIEVLRNELWPDTGRVWVQGPRTDRPHCVAQLPSGGLVDLTAKQFDAEGDNSECPMYFASLDDLGRAWQRYTLSNWHDDADAVWVEAPEHCERPGRLV